MTLCATTAARTQIVVNGTLTATGTTFTGGTAAPTPHQVNSGGHLIATNSTFSITQLSLNNGSVLNSGDLTGDTFNLPLYVPYGDVQYLGGNIKLPAGRHQRRHAPQRQTLNLNPIGTNTSSLQLRLPRRLHGGIGGDAERRAQRSRPGRRRPDVHRQWDADLRHRRHDDSMAPTAAAAQIVVNGTLTATATTFTSRRQAPTIQVNSGGHLIATSSTFSITQLTLDNGSVLNSGDLTGDTFNLPIYVPYGDVQYLARQRQASSRSTSTPHTLAERDAQPQPDRHQHVQPAATSSPAASRWHRGRR